MFRFFRGPKVKSYQHNHFSSFFPSLYGMGRLLRSVLQDCLGALFPDLNTPFSVSTASPNNPAVYGDPGEPALHCGIRPSYPGCVPAVLCPASLRVILFPSYQDLKKKKSQNNFLFFDGLIACFLVASFSLIKRKGRTVKKIKHWLTFIAPK